MKKKLIGGFVAITIAMALIVTVNAAIDRENQDFEGLNQAAGDSLANEGWLVFANVFSAGGFYLYGYGPFPAPNGGPGFSGIDIGQGGPAQGDQQLVVYSDYNNADHANGSLIEANVFQERRVSSSDVDTTWLFQFDAKRGNINENPALPPASAAAFIKVLDPANGFATTAFLTFDTTSLPDAWGTYSIEIDLNGGFLGQIIQWGFTNTSTNYQGTGVFYDNVSFNAVMDDDSSDDSSDSDSSDDPDTAVGGSAVSGAYEFGQSGSSDGSAAEIAQPHADTDDLERRDRSTRGGKGLKSR